MKVFISLVYVFMCFFFVTYSMEFDTDSGHRNFVEEVFENESRVPGGNWGCSSIQWTDMVNIWCCLHHNINASSILSIAVL